jgi:hypothetical protein
MQILFLTNFSLVHGLDEEEQSCQQVVEGLREFKLSGVQE